VVNTRLDHRAGFATWGRMTRKSLAHSMCSRQVRSIDTSTSSRVIREGWRTPHLVFRMPRQGGYLIASDLPDNVEWISISMIDRYKVQPMTPEDLLGQISIPTPSTANWDEMEGDRRSRFCRDIGKTVFDLKQMSEVELISLLKECEDDFCGRITRRKDGKVVTEPTIGPFRFTIRSILALVAYVAALLGFVRFSTQSVVAGGIRRIPRVAPGTPATTQAGNAGVTCEDFTSAQEGLVVRQAQNAGLESPQTTNFAEIHPAK
jgi:hypothetical protein